MDVEGDRLPPSGNRILRLRPDDAGIRPQNISRTPVSAGTLCPDGNAPHRPPRIRFHDWECSSPLLSNQRRHVLKDLAQLLGVSPPGRGQLWTSAPTAAESFAECTDNSTGL